MSNFYMENWDLQAVVGESSNEYACISDMENPAFSFDPWSFQQGEDPMSFPEVFETNPNVLDELGELYKPFYPALNPYSKQTIITSSLPVLQDHVEEPANQKQQQPDSQSAISATNRKSAKPKRSSRKNQQNRVVQHVTAGDPSDIWSWRKYGQKPIKGSPYPRSYYRCSSSKGCLARKQVERSCSDPRMFIITYTAEHTHGGHPTRRNSLAVCTRNKSPTVPKSDLAKKNEPHEAEETVVSPTTNSKVTIKEGPLKQESIKKEELQQMLDDFDQIQGDKILTPNIMLSDELVQSQENFEGLFLDQFPDLSHELLWSMNESANLTGGLLN